VTPSSPGPPSPARSALVAPARLCAFAVIRRVFEHEAYADRAFGAEAADLDPRDRSLAMRLAYGTVQRRATLDHVAARLSSRPLSAMDPPVLAALRLGLLQILFLDGVAEHAAVHESVELAKLGGRGGAGLVNAVLRRATRDGRAILSELSDATPSGAAVLHSVPLWLAELWWRELGSEAARALLTSVNEPAESALRVNTLVASRDEVLRELPVAAHAVPGLPEALVLEAPFDVHGSPLWQRGAIMAQSRGSMLAARALAPEPGDRVLDLCAAPGAKTTQLAALMGDDGELIAVERHPGRARALRVTLDRMHAGCATVRVGDAAAIPAGAAGGGEPFDAVLVDPPCSGLGTLQSRPDLRWRTSPERIADLAGLQARILRAGAQATGPGGALVYSVCTISRAESERVVESFLAEHRDFAAEDPSGPPPGDGPYLRTLPHRDGTDGFFIARLRREGRRRAR
jgi:16S rRNA (cytosine967-C5)-methyltransferase